MMNPLHQESPLVAHTLVLACAEEGAYDPTWRAMLRRHALVLRTQRGDEPAVGTSLVAPALRAHPIERVIVLGHVGCRARDEVRVEPAPSTAAVSAYCRYVDAACMLVKRRARGELSNAETVQKLDLLVHLANLEACAELHAALRWGTASVHAALYDPATREVGLFDGADFRRVERAEICRLITGAGPTSAVREDDFAGPFTALALTAAPTLGAQQGGLP